MKKSSRRRYGFTLVEIMLVSVILGCVAAGLGGVLVSGLRLWSRITSSSGVQDMFRIDLEVVARDIRQAQSVPEIGMEGDRSHFIFAMVHDGQVVRVAYEVRVNEGGLVRRVERLADIRAGQETPVEKRMLAATDLSLEYLVISGQGVTRSEEWTKELGLCQAVSLRGKYQDEEFEKVVFIPAG
jgi:prepilin-type N-terminal cleavage/methylation domain-containing protein